MHRSFIAVFCSLLWSVCTVGAELMPGEGASRGAAPGVQRTVASLQLVNGAQVDFVDLLDGHVGVGEKVPRGQRPASQRLASRWQATPLEIFLALAPRGAVAPEILWRDHAQYAARTGSSPAPRNLAGQVGVFGPTDPGEELADCDAFGSFGEDWLAAFAGLTDYAFAEARHFLDGSWTFYPGKHVYDGTNTNSVTYLGACNGFVVGGAVTMTMQVHRRIKIVDGNDVSVSWAQVAEVELGNEEKYTFYSNFPASYRGRVIGSIVDHYVVAVAYDKTGGLATP